MGGEYIYIYIYIYICYRADLLGETCSHTMTRVDELNCARWLETHRFGVSKITNCSLSVPHIYVGLPYHHRSRHSDNPSEHDQSHEISKVQSAVKLFLRLSD